MSCFLTLSRTGGKSQDLVVGNRNKRSFKKEGFASTKAKTWRAPWHGILSSGSPSPQEIGGTFGPPGSDGPANFSLTSFRLSLISLCKVHEANLQGCINSQNNFTKIEFFTQQVTFFHENQILHHTVAHYICFRTVISQLNFCPYQPASNLAYLLLSNLYTQ